MPKSTKPVPEGQPALSPYLTVDGAAAAIEYYRKVFGAVEIARLTAPDGKIGHAEIDIGGSRIMLSDEFPEFGALSPKSVGGSPVTLHLYVEDVDAVFERAVGAGAQATRPVADQFYGDRSGKLKDPFGHFWSLATRIEDVSWDEMKRRAAAIFGG